MTFDSEFLISLICFVIAGIAIGYLIGCFWYKKTDIRKPKRPGVEKRECFTQGELFAIKARKSIKQFFTIDKKVQ